MLFEGKETMVAINKQVSTQLAPKLLQRDRGWNRMAGMDFNTYESDHCCRRNIIPRLGFDMMDRPDAIEVIFCQGVSLKGSSSEIGLTRAERIGTNPRRGIPWDNETSLSSQRGWSDFQEDSDKQERAAIVRVPEGDVMNHDKQARRS